MQILVISNFYPPHFIGGYELGCRDIVDALRQRGHDVRVLTSRHGVGRPEQSGHVYRWLETDLDLKINDPAADWRRVIRKEAINRQAFERVCQSFTPDLVYVWNATHISLSIAIRAQQMDIKVCYFISDHWLTEWEHDALYSLSRRTPRRLHRRLAWRLLMTWLRANGTLMRDHLDLSRVQFASRFLKQAALAAGRPVADAEVIHWGIDIERFPFNEAARRPVRLLYVGQLTALKGVHTAIEALKKIRENPLHTEATLTVVGGPDYDDRLHRLAASLGVGPFVNFTGLLPREQLPTIYRAHDVLIFPSVWDEPFSITLLEAMACGLAVVGTNTGGSAEILRDEENALIFAKEDSSGCAGQVSRLLRDTGLFERLRREGRRAVEERFGLDRMVDHIERELGKHAGASETLKTAAAGERR
jgi:glycosyltransferase involved in cell wall biosynthesis